MYSDDDPWGETARRLYVRADGCDSSTIVMPDRNNQAQHRKFSGNLLPVAASRRAEVPDPAKLPLAPGVRRRWWEAPLWCSCRREIGLDGQFGDGDIPSCAKGGDRTEE